MLAISRNQPELGVEVVTCPCGKGETKKQCCGPLLAGERQAETAEMLMRSRYTAYAEGNIDYILSTHDPKTVDEVDVKGAAQWSKQSKWLGMEIVSSEGGGADDTEGIVEFVANYELGGRKVRHHERAEFRKSGGRWFFVDGKMVKPEPVRVGPKTGRNEPCPCGSGKKFKKCCGR